MTPAQARALRKLADRLAATTAERNRLIVEAHRGGASLREIEKHAGLTHVAIWRIIKRTEENG